MASYRTRKTLDVVLRWACLVATLCAMIPLISILLFVGREGIKGLSLDFLTHLPKPVGELGGGVANAIVGTVTIVAMACAMAIPAGILAGVYLAEYGKSRLGYAVRFTADVLSGVPSIVVGMFVYAVVVIPMKRQSAIAGSIAIAILMLPTIARTTEELMKLVPNALREAALALGVPRWRTVLRVVVRTALPGIVTGIMLAVARGTGETAPLLFTSANNRNWPEGIDQPTSTLTVQIFQYSVAPYDDWHQQAWAAALVLIAFVLGLNILSRLLVRHRVSR
ncbi:MAG: phosphate ABC transporter permease PstA [Myxococcales bacterium]|nr:phosphate ABC transporter permease PstA [Myxococcales bacterium]